MQAIITKWHGQTATRPARISATADAGRVYIRVAGVDGIHYSGSYDEAIHRTAAQKLCKKFGWRWCHVPGALHNGGYAWVDVSEYAGSRRLP